jgi:NADPH:quinone reductase-like Zn-dependent oxidoreductase
MNRQARSLLASFAALAFSAVASLAGAEGGDTMKAVRMADFGGADVLKYEDAPKPTVGAGEVLIHVKASGVNPVDWKLRDGMGRGMLKPPFILGFDVAGVVEAADAGVKDFKVGDEVYVYLPIAKGGGYAEYVSAAADVVAKKPAKADFVHAAATPLAALTAWQALFDKANLQPGQTVLIHGGAGGVGHFAVQFAAWKGATVIATSSATNAEFVKSLGATTVIDYKKEKFEDIAKNVDVVFDMIGGDTLARSYQCLKEGGFLVSIVAPPDQTKLAEKKAKGAIFLVQPNSKQLTEIAGLIDAGKVKPDVSATFPLQDAAKAQEQSKSGSSGRGKIVLTVP